MKRRVIYLSDEEWAVAKRLAKDTGLTISTVIRALLADRAKAGELPRLDDVRLALKGARGLALDSNEPGLDAEFGRAIDSLDRFNSRPFTPVPKTKGK